MYRFRDDRAPELFAPIHRLREKVDLFKLSVRKSSLLVVEAILHDWIANIVGSDDIGNVTVYAATIDNKPSPRIPYYMLYDGCCFSERCNCVEMQFLPRWLYRWSVQHSNFLGAMIRHNDETIFHPEPFRKAGIDDYAFYNVAATAVNVDQFNLLFKYYTSNDLEIMRVIKFVDNDMQFDGINLHNILCGK